MLSRIEVRNFQSIEHIDIELGPLTVIVGTTNAGKSAFTRALRMLTSNARGTAFIRHGQQTCIVSATTDRGTVILKKGRGNDEYVTIPADQDLPQRTFTKLGGQVPEEVTEFIGIEPKDPINYAGQFDRPFMLDDTGNEVARVLGALTGVNVIFEGAAEARRQQLRANATLKDRAGTLTDVMAKIDDYRPLKGYVAAQNRAEAALERAQEAERRWLRLQEHLTELEVARETLAELEAAPSIDVEALTGILKRAQVAAARLRLLDAHVEALRQGSTALRKAEEALVLAQEDITISQQQYLDLLTEAGTCPTCGQSTKHLEHA